MPPRSARLGLLLTATALTNAAVARGTDVKGADGQLNEIPVEAARPTSVLPAGAGFGGANVSGGNGNSAATGGGGGGPRVSPPTVTLSDALVAYDVAALDPKDKGFRAPIHALNLFDRSSTTCQAGFLRSRRPRDGDRQPDLSLVAAPAGQGSMAGSRPRHWRSMRLLS